MQWSCRSWQSPSDRWHRTTAPRCPSIDCPLPESIHQRIGRRSHRTRTCRYLAAPTPPSRRRSGTYWANRSRTAWSRACTGRCRRHRRKGWRTASAPRFAPSHCRRGAYCSRRSCALPVCTTRCTPSSNRCQYMRRGRSWCRATSRADRTAELPAPSGCNADRQGCRASACCRSRLLSRLPTRPPATCRRRRRACLDSRRARQRVPFPRLSSLTRKARECLGFGCRPATTRRRPREVLHDKRVSRPFQDLSPRSHPRPGRPKVTHEGAGPDPSLAPAASAQSKKSNSMIGWFNAQPTHRSSEASYNMGPIPLAMLIAHHLAERRHWFACIHAQNERQPPCPRLNTSRPYRSSHARRTTET